MAPFLSSNGGGDQVMSKLIEEANMPLRMVGGALGATVRKQTEDKIQDEKVSHQKQLCYNNARMVTHTIATCSYTVGIY